MIPIPSNIKLIASGVTIIASLTAGAYINGLRWEHKLDSALKAQETLLVTQCNDAKKITEDASNDYQTKLAASNRKLSEYRRMYSSTKVSITSTPDGPNATTSGTLNSGANGVAASSLFELAGECEQYRNQVAGLQGFINRVWQR
jgi:hypothetical protein